MKFRSKGVFAMKIKKLIILIAAVIILFSSSDFKSIAYSQINMKKGETIVGAATQSTWNFKADKSGIYKIVFTYSRSWEKKASDEKKIIYNVKVTDKKNKDKSIIELSPNKKNHISTGQCFSITLEENLSTGYSWGYEISPTGITFLQTETAPINSVPLHKVWTFFTKKSGTSDIVFTYARSSGKDTLVSKTVTYKVKVSGKDGLKLDPVVLTEGDVNILYKGQKFMVSIKGNSSVGYVWNHKENSKIIKLEKEESINDLIKYPQKVNGGFKQLDTNKLK
jgi:Predicted secreted protein